LPDVACLDRRFTLCHGSLAPQAITLANLAVYLDVDRPRMALPRGCSVWAALTMEQWDMLYLPANHVPATTTHSTTRTPAAPATTAAALATEDDGSRLLAQGREGSPVPLGGVGAVVLTAAAAEPAAAPGKGLAGLLPQSALGSMICEHDFLIRPVSGMLRYTRR
jgi:hypothetical protein